MTTRTLLVTAALCCAVLAEAPVDPYGLAAAYASPEAQYTPKDNAYGVQSGYEGYLVPMDNTPSLLSGLLASHPGLLGGAGGSGGLFSGNQGLLGSHSLLGRPWLHGLLPRIGLKLAGKVGLWLLGFTAVVLVGGGFTVAVCTLTPICTLTFLGFGLSRQSMRSYLTTDRLTAAAAFVNDAIDKYRVLQGLKKPSYKKLEGATAPGKDKVEEEDLQDIDGGKS